MDKTLEQLCVESVAKYIGDEIYKTFPKKLNKELSNKVFDEYIHLHNEDKCPTSRINIQNMLNVSEMRLSMSNFTDNDCDMVLAQNLESLKLLSLRTWDMFLKEYDGDSFTNPIELLSMILNPTSQQSLRELHINFECVTFSVLWLSELPALLPSLTSLTIRYGYIVEEDDFEIICDNFENLTNLDLSSSTIYTLDGLKKLQKLQSLNLSSIILSKKESVKDILELKNLRVLEIAGCIDRFSTLLTHLLEYDKGLPELHTLDCSHTKITDDMIEKITQRFSKLKVLRLLGKPFTTNKDLTDNGRINVLKNDTRKEFFDSFEYFIRNENRRDDQLEYLQEYFFSDLNSTELTVDEGFFDMFLSDLATYNSRSSIRLTCDWIHTLTSVCNDEIGATIPVWKKQILIKTLLKLPCMSERHPVRQMNLMTSWFILKFFTDLESPKLSAETHDSVCQRAVHYLRNNDDSSVGPCVLWAIVKHIKHMTKDGNLRIGRDEVLYGKVADWLKRDLESFNINNYTFILTTLIETLCELREDKSERWLTTNERNISNLAYMIRYIEEFAEWDLHILSVLKTILMSSGVSTAHKFLEYLNFKKFTKSLFNEDISVQRSTCDLLHYVYFITRYNEDQPDDWEETILKMRKDAVNSLARYERFRSGLEPFIAVYEWFINDCDLDETKEWAQYTLSLFEGKVKTNKSGKN